MDGACERCLADDGARVVVPEGPPDHDLGPVPRPRARDRTGGLRDHIAGRGRQRPARREDHRGRRDGRVVRRRPQAAPPLARSGLVRGIRAGRARHAALDRGHHGGRAPRVRTPGPGRPAARRRARTHRPGARECGRGQRCRRLRSHALWHQRRGRAERRDGVPVRRARARLGCARRHGRVARRVGRGPRAVGGARRARARPRARQAGREDRNLAACAPAGRHRPE